MAHLKKAKSHLEEASKEMAEEIEEVHAVVAKKVDQLKKRYNKLSPNDRKKLFVALAGAASILSGIKLAHKVKKGCKKRAKAKIKKK